MAKLEAEEDEDLANKAMIEDLDKLTSELENEIKSGDPKTTLVKDADQSTKK